MQAEKICLFKKDLKGQDPLEWRAAQAPRWPTEWSAGKPVTPGAGTQPQDRS